MSAVQQPNDPADETVSHVTRIVNECATCRRQRFQYRRAVAVALLLFVLGVVLPDPVAVLPVPNWITGVLSLGALVVASALLLLP